MSRNWLKELRKAKKIKLTDISKKSGITVTYYKYIENGLRRPSPQVAQKIAKILDFDWKLFFEI